MAERIAAADVAVGAGGSSAWERCCLGLPSLTVIVADNQRENTTALAREGATLAIAPPSGDFEARLLAGFTSLASDAKLRASMSARAAALCDGLGADRVAERLLAQRPRVWDQAAWTCATAPPISPSVTRFARLSGRRADRGPAPRGRAGRHRHLQRP